MHTSRSSIVRRSLTSLVAVVAAGAFAAPAHAQTAGQMIKVAIPFAFQNGSTQLNPGVYTLRSQSEDILALRDHRGYTATLFIATPSDATRPANVSKVVFHRYGDRYFLREVWMAGSSSHLECPRSKAERLLQRERQLVSTTEPADGTEVALLQLPN